MKTAYLHACPIQIGLHSQKLIFKAKIIGGRGPMGVSRGRTPQESDLFYSLERLYQFKFEKQAHNLLRPNLLFFKIAQNFFFCVYKTCVEKWIE